MCSPPRGSHPATLSSSVARTEVDAIDCGDVLGSGGGSRAFRSAGSRRPRTGHA